MARTNIDLDERAVSEVMRRFDFATKRDAVNYALRALAGEPMTTDEALSMFGRGWSGDLGQMREGRVE